MLAVYLIRKNDFNIEYATNKGTHSFNAWLDKQMDKLLKKGFTRAELYDYNTGERIYQKTLRPKPCRHSLA